MRTSVIVGASSGLGRAIAEQLAQRSHAVHLVARDPRDLEPLARDLAIRFNANTSWSELDLCAFDADDLARRLLERFGALDNLFLVAGLGDDSDNGPLPDARLCMLFEANCIGLIRIANALLTHLASRPAANIVGIGSVAAVRGRRFNMVYGSAKRGLEAYFESLRHYLARSSCRIQFYRAGFMKTTMLGNRRSVLPAAEPADVAAYIIQRLDKDRGIGYAPNWWRWIALGLRILPWPLFKRLSI